MQTKARGCVSLDRHYGWEVSLEGGEGPYPKKTVKIRRERSVTFLFKFLFINCTFLSFFGPANSYGLSKKMVKTKMAKKKMAKKKMVKKKMVKKKMVKRSGYKEDGYMKEGSLARDH